MEFRAAEDAQLALRGVGGFDPAPWRELMRGARPPLRDPLEFEPGGQRDGWQHEAARDMSLFRRIPEGARALIRSQAGQMAGMAFSVTPSKRLTRLESHVIRTQLLRRLRQPLPLSDRLCRCGPPLDPSGHRAACARAGVLGRRSFALASATARVCREAGGTSQDQSVDEGDGRGPKR